MDQIAHGYVASRATDDAVYRPSLPLQPHPNQSQPCQGFQYYQPSQQSFLHPSPQQQHQLPWPHCQTYYQPLSQPSYQSPSWAQQHYQSTVIYHTPSSQPQHDDPAHQIVRPRAQRPQSHRGITIRPPAAHHPISTIARRTRATGTRQWVMWVMYELVFSFIYHGSLKPYVRSVKM
ncbi:hypothetical protein PIB30_047555 [Stylosanthes scabra]|uniref:Uncharacterized protein n=1 Tax=Stylosanthes scabra TaxID=79078 RepID=A0ABU6UHC8_9FABA|nr:hypothetical protein [Stylosanthes scabra]